MPSHPAQILTINAGSSSIKFALYTADAEPRRKLYGQIQRIGRSGTQVSCHSASGEILTADELGSLDHRAAGQWLLDWLSDGHSGHDALATVQVAAHRVVHGMQHSAPERVTPELLAELRGIRAYAPDHLPQEIALIEMLGVRCPQLPQIACFDTAFHQTMPTVARQLPIPRRYFDEGLQRYGFHGLSYAYLLQELRRLGDPAATQGRVILAHLGNGASMVAVRNGQSVDTSMGFTPAAGLVMSTRSGDLDPGIAAYLARREALSPQQFNDMVNFQSGLLGISGGSSDMRDLLARAARDPHAAEAVELFCYQARKFLGAYTAVLGGLDTLVFSGGIGENAAEVRAQICEGLGYLGLRLDPERNLRHAAVISSADSRVTVYVIATDEDMMLARSVRYIYPGG